MEPAKTESSDLKTMIADYMENGFLDNIVDMFKNDKSLYEYVGDLLSDERIRVRIGVIALFETLTNEDKENVTKAIPSILPLLKHENAVIRGDAAFLLGIIGHPDSIPTLMEITGDEDANVGSIAKEAIDDIKSTNRV